MFGGSLLFSLSISAVKSSILSYFIFSPVQASDLKSSVPNMICIAVILSLLNLAGFLAAKAFNINIVKAVYELIASIFTKSLISFVIVIFALLMSLVYSLLVKSGRLFSASYMCMVMLSSVHLPLVLFLRFFKDDQKLLGMGTVIMFAQGFIADYMCRSAIGYKENLTGQRRGVLIVTSLACHLLFFGVVVPFLYSR